MSSVVGVVFVRSNDVDPDPRVEKAAKTLSQAGYAVKIIGWDRDLQVKESKHLAPEIPIYRLRLRAPHGRGFKNIISMLGFQLIVATELIARRESYQVIHACNFDTGLVALVLARILKKKIVYDIFDFYCDSFPVPTAFIPLVRHLEHFVIRNSDCVIICTQQREEQILPSKPKNLVVIHNSPELLHVPKPNPVKGLLRIGYVGTLSEGRFLREALSVISNRRDVELHIAGFGELAQEIKEVGSEIENIFYYGKVSYNRGLQISSSCDLMLASYDPKVPNHKYSAPNKFYESLILRTPILVAGGTGVDQLVIEHKTGYSIDYSIESFELFLTQLLAGEIDRVETEHFHDLYENNYSWREMRSRLLEAYRGL
jgi:glycosyltransferase involved in cell wall biosynthesis